jgi:hypothetical protein
VKVRTGYVIQNGETVKELFEEWVPYPSVRQPNWYVESDADVMIDTERLIRLIKQAKTAGGFNRSATHLCLLRKLFDMEDAGHTHVSLQWAYETFCQCAEDNKWYAKKRVL